MFCFFIPEILDQIPDLGVQDVIQGLIYNQNLVIKFVGLDFRLQCDFQRVTRSHVTHSFFKFWSFNFCPLHHIPDTRWRIAEKQASSFSQLNPVLMLVSGHLFKEICRIARVTFSELLCKHKIAFFCFLFD